MTAQALIPADNSTASAQYQRSTGPVGQLASFAVRPADDEEHECSAGCRRCASAEPAQPRARQPPVAATEALMSPGQRWRQSKRIAVHEALRPAPAVTQAGAGSALFQPMLYAWSGSAGPAETGSAPDPTASDRRPPGVKRPRRSAGW